MSLMSLPAIKDSTAVLSIDPDAAAGIAAAADVSHPRDPFPLIFSCDSVTRSAKKIDDSQSQNDTPTDERNVSNVRDVPPHS